MNARHETAMQYIFKKKNVKPRSIDDNGKKNFRITLKIFSKILDYFSYLDKKNEISILNSLSKHFEKEGWPNATTKKKVTRILEAYGKKTKIYTD